MSNTTASKRQINDEGEELFSFEEVFPDSTPGSRLVGARYKEDMTQKQLAEATGIPRRHISEMENNKRPIGKQNAHKLVDVLQVYPCSFWWSNLSFESCGER